MDLVTNDLSPRFLCRHDQALMRIRVLTQGVADSWVFQCSECLRWFDAPSFALTEDEVIEGLARAKIVVDKRDKRKGGKK